MLEYVERRLSDGSATPVPIIGGEARTGRPTRVVIDPAQLRLAGASKPELNS